jgi:hypothetical protein
MSRTMRANHKWTMYTLYRQSDYLPAFQVQVFAPFIVLQWPQIADTTHRRTKRVRNQLKNHFFVWTALKAMLVFSRLDSGGVRCIRTLQCVSAYYSREFIECCCSNFQMMDFLPAILAWSCQGGPGGAHSGSLPIQLLRPVLVPGILQSIL